MHDIAHMQESKAAQDIVDEFDQMVFREVNLVFQQGVQVRINKFNNKTDIHQVI
jgi:hypothetical protein